MEVYLVTGGAGFIGSHFIKLLHKQRPDAVLINADKLTYAGNIQNIGAIQEKMQYTFVHQDICDKLGMREIFRQYKPDYVVNFAAESHVDRSIQDSEAFVKTNVLGTQVLLQLSVDYGVRRFLQISTDEVYGSTEHDALADESALLLPGNPYAASKAAGDMLALSYSNTYKLPVLITRSSNNFGPNQHREKLIPMVIAQCMSCGRIPVYGDGLNTRDWIFVEDNCRGIYKVLDKGTPGNIYNISAGNVTDNISLIKLIIETVRDMLPEKDLRRKIINEELMQCVEDRKGHDRGYSISSDKIRSLLDWKPERELLESLRYTVKWYLENVFA